MTVRSHIRRPRAVTASLTAREVAKAYNYPTQYTGKGFTCGIIELGGGFGEKDLQTYFGNLGLPVPDVTAVDVDGGKNSSDGPDGADGEVLLDIEVAAAVAPGAKFRVYFCSNTDASFLAGIQQAVTDGCSALSISWGQAENQWKQSSLAAFDAAFLAARKAGCVVFAAAGDNGADDSTGKPVTDFPASSPNVIGCGGTRLTVKPDGSRSSEVAWDDNDASSATGGGVSQYFPVRQVPDVAGNADPSTGYEVVVDGSSYVIGGTSAVAPLYAGLTMLLCEALGEPLGKKVDLLNTLATNPNVCFDVTSGDNGAFRVGPGRDDVTGYGVVDGTKLLDVLTNDVADPAPIGTPTPAPTPVPPTPTGVASFPGATVVVDQHIRSAASRAHLTVPGWLNHHFIQYFDLGSAAAAPHQVIAGREHEIDRDAKTGQFVDSGYAAEHPDTTSEETMQPGETAGGREAYRDVRSGEFVSEKDAQADPDHTEKDHLH